MFGFTQNDQIIYAPQDFSAQDEILLAASYTKTEYQPQPKPAADRFCDVSHSFGLEGEVITDRYVQTPLPLHKLAALVAAERYRRETAEIQGIPMERSLRQTLLSITPLDEGVAVKLPRNTRYFTKEEFLSLLSAINTQVQSAFLWEHKTLERLKTEEDKLAVMIEQFA